MSKKFVFFFLLSSLMFVHTFDMLVTEYYIGENWELETFPIMSICIKTFGIHGAVWLSRAVMYSYFFLALVNSEKKYWFYFLICADVLYWTAMIPWFFQLGLTNWPFPQNLCCY
jgi:hypothetical protein